MFILIFLKLKKKGIDVKSIGRIFVGLCKCGAWGCFDEFNRLEEAVLSAVSMQIQVIQDSLRSRSGRTTLLGKEVIALFIFILIITLIIYI
jgi:dynein heavy chain 2